MDPKNIWEIIGLACNQWYKCEVIRICAGSYIFSLHRMGIFSPTEAYLYLFCLWMCSSKMEIWGEKKSAATICSYICVQAVKLN